MGHCPGVLSSRVVIERNAKVDVRPRANLGTVPPVYDDHSTFGDANVESEESPSDHFNAQERRRATLESEFKTIFALMG